MYLRELCEIYRLQVEALKFACFLCFSPDLASTRNEEVLYGSDVNQFYHQEELLSKKVSHLSYLMMKMH